MLSPRRAYVKQCVVLLVVMVCMALVLGVSQPSSAASLTAGDRVSLQSAYPLKLIDRRLLGQTVDGWNTTVLTNPSETYQTIEIATAVRGPANGLYADFYHWEDPLGIGDSRRRDRSIPGPGSASASPDSCTHPQELKNQLGTLDYLRVGRDRNVALISIVNSKGVPNWYFWPDANNPYITTGLNELKQLAADWVLYTHYTVKNFNQSQPPSANSPSALEKRSAAVLAALRWQNCAGTNSRPTLPQPGEALPEITYWEIGNEPNFGLAGVYWSPAQYAARYGVLNTSNPRFVGITNSMIEMDIAIHGQKTIKIGPALMSDNSTEPYLRELKNAGATVDFVSYHPYTQIFGYWRKGEYTQLPDVAEKWQKADYKYLRDQMNGIYNSQKSRAAAIRNVYPGVELLATEWNPSDWQVNWRIHWREESMAQTLAVMETIFSFARVGVSQAHYYTLPVSNDSPAHITNPTYKTFAFLKSHLFDPKSDSHLLAAYDNNTSPGTYYRGYAVQHGASGLVSLWGLNWDSNPRTVNFSLEMNSMFRYSMFECSRLSAPSLLVGSLGDEGALPLADELHIVQTPEALTWNNGQINYMMTIPPSSWVACFINRTPVSTIYSNYLPIVARNTGATFARKENELDAPQP